MKSNKKLFILTEAVLAVMAILTAIGMLRGKNSEEREKVSVIIQRSDDTRWVAFKYGLRMAAQDEEMELFIVSMGEGLTAEKEQKAIEEEIDKGADAVIVQPALGDTAHEMLKKLEKKVPVILVEESTAGETRGAGIPVVKPDNYAIGQALAEELLKDYNGKVQGKTMGLVAEYGTSEAIQERKKGAISILKEMGVKQAWEISDPPKDEENMVLERKSKVDFVIALDDYSLLLAGKAAADHDLHGALVYGVGNSMGAVYCLDAGYVQCLAIPNDFDMGYQSLVNAAESLEHIFHRPKSQTVGFTIMRKKNLFSKENQEILFTMSQ